MTSYYDIINLISMPSVGVLIKIKVPIFWYASSRYDSDMQERYCLLNEIVSEAEKFDGRTSRTNHLSRSTNSFGCEIFVDGSLKKIFFDFKDIEIVK